VRSAFPPVEILDRVACLAAIRRDVPLHGGADVASTKAAIGASRVRMTSSNISNGTFPSAPTAQSCPFTRRGCARSALRGRPPSLPLLRAARAFAALRCALRLTDTDQLSQPVH